MRPAETTAELAGFSARGPGTDSERRAANWLAQQIERGGRAPELETFWCRPNWALAHAWHVALALAGSLVSVSTPHVGGVLIVVALLSLVADEQVGLSPGRRLTPERASQNVVAPPAPRKDRHTERLDTPVRLIITAHYDSGRIGIVYRDRPRRVAARIRAILNGITFGWLGWFAILLVWLLATTIARAGGARGTAIGVVQLVPTVALVLMLAALIDIATAPYGPGAGDNASGVGVALAIAAALDAAPPRHLATELVLAGAGEAGGMGMRRYLRSRRRELSPGNAIILGLAPSAGGALHWWVSDGPLIPLRYFRELRKLCAALAAEDAELGASPYRGRGATPALLARASGLPAIAIGCLDREGLAPRSHQPSDTAEKVKAEALDATVEYGLMLVDSIDSFIGRTRAATTPRPTRV